MCVWRGIRVNNNRGILKPTFTIFCFFVARGQRSVSFQSGNKSHFCNTERSFDFRPQSSHTVFVFVGLCGLLKNLFNKINFFTFCYCNKIRNINELIVLFKTQRFFCFCTSFACSQRSFEFNCFFFSFSFFC